MIEKEKEDHSIDARLMRAHPVIVNAKEHKTIREAIAQYNYDEARLNEGLEMYNSVYQLHHQRQSAWGEQLRVTGELHEKLAAFQKKYTGHLALARLALAQPKIRLAPNPS